MQSNDEFYSKNAVQFSSETLSVDMTSLYLPFLSLLPSGAKLLDAGCGSGRDTKYFMEQGFAVTAFDKSSELCRLASQLTGLNVINQGFEDFDLVQEFQGIWACASLLHVKKQDLPAVFAKLAKVLDDHGIMYCSFKHGDFEGERDGRYYTDLTLAELSLVIESSQLAVKSHWMSSDLRSGRESEQWLNAILQKM